MKSVELFAGAGGLALGISKAGFFHEAVVEWDRDACNTIRKNQEREIALVSDWPLFEADVRAFDYSMIRDGLDFLGGGPPCQPFSLGGKHRGQNDSRNMFPEAVRAVRELRPKAFMFENVKGLLRESFAKYFEYIILQLTYPDVVKKEKEDWTEHLSRLERFHTGGKCKALCYHVIFGLFNAANYGVPQKRERVIIVGFRSDLGLEWSFPQPTHSQEALLWDQWVTKEYWERHRVARKDRPEPSPRYEMAMKRLTFSKTSPWRTVRDAISDLPDPEKEKQAILIPDHRFNPGARSYSGHTGSPLDEPAKTLKAGDHGVPGGENMVVFPNGKIRYFTVRESARLQNFPDDFIFGGSWTESMRQLGNAVPVDLANIMADSIRKRLERTFN